LNRSPFVRALLVSAALSAAVALSGCNTDSILPMSEKAARPLPEKLVKEIESKNMDKESPILVRLFKEESELEVWKQDREGRFALLKTYPICRWSGELGPKIKEGDRQASEDSQHLPPDESELAISVVRSRLSERLRLRLWPHRRAAHGARRLFVARLPFDDRRAAFEIYALGRDPSADRNRFGAGLSVPNDGADLAKHRNSPHLAFWKMLKKGNDHFEVSKLEPKVSVATRYVFDAQSPTGRAVVQRDREMPGV
jgi:hypothetical protein